ncbi:hypothetical protein FRB93_006277 [Tulasnella sp. JGI-2019a]|nr:hypothetical protein FRB93_006277 [Tulasnella sp. JGI-2019a]
MTTQSLQVLVFIANEQKPRFISVKVKGGWAQVGDVMTKIRPLIEGTKGKGSSMSVTTMTGLPGPLGLRFNPPFQCFHRDWFLQDGSPLNIPALRWQLEDYGSEAHPWAGNLIVVKLESLLGDELLDVTEEDLPELRKWFSRYNRKY